MMPLLPSKSDWRTSSRVCPRQDQMPIPVITTLFIFLLLSIFPVCPSFVVETYWCVYNKLSGIYYCNSWFCQPYIFIFICKWKVDLCGRVIVDSPFPASPSFYKGGI